MNLLKDKVCCVTGAGKGIGFKIAKTMAEHGAIIYGIDKEFFLTEEEMPYTPIHCDLSSPGQRSLVSEKIKNYHSYIDILVNNAGMTIPTEHESYSLSDWRDTFQINVEAPFDLTRMLVPMLKKSSFPSIVNITSLNAAMAFPDNPAYVSSKTALAGLTRSMALDYGKYNIRVNSVAPGYINTDMTSRSWKDIEMREKRSSRTILNRWGKPEEVANAVIFLSSNLSSYITGQSLFVDGGWSIKGL